MQALALTLYSVHHAGQDFGRLTEPALRIGGADWQNAPTHTDRTLPDQLTITATAQTRESGEIDMPIALVIKWVTIAVAVLSGLALLLFLIWMIPP